MTRRVAALGLIIACLLVPKAVAEEERPTLEESAAALGCLVSLEIHDGALTIDREAWTTWARGRPDANTPPEELDALAAKRYGVPLERVDDNLRQSFKEEIGKPPDVALFDRILRATGAYGSVGGDSTEQQDVSAESDSLEGSLLSDEDDGTFELHLVERLGAMRRLDVEQAHAKGLLLRLECPKDDASLLLWSWPDGRVAFSTARRGQALTREARTFEDLVRSSPNEVETLLARPLAEIGIVLPGMGAPPSEPHAQGPGLSKEQVEKAQMEEMSRADTSIATLEASPWIGRCMAFSPDGGTLAYGGEDGVVRLWVTSGWTERRRLPDAGIATVFSPDGKWLVAYGWPGGVRIIDMGTLKVTRTLDHTSGRVVFSPDGKLLYLTEGQGQHTRVVVVGFEDDKEVRAFDCSCGGLQDLSLSPDGKRLGCAFYGLYRVWDTESGHLERSFERMCATCVDFGTSGEEVFIGGRARGVNRWNLAAGRSSLVYYGELCEAETLCVSPDGALLAMGDGYGNVKVCEVKTARRVALLQGHLKRVMSLAWSPDGRLLASAGYREPVKVWRMRE